MEARFAGGSMVLVYLFHKNIHVVNVFVKNIGFLPPCRRRYPPLNVESPDPCRHWSFRGFRSCRVVRGPNSHRVTPVTYRTYAVGVCKSDMCSHNGSLRLRQHGTFLSFSRTCGSVSHMFVKKDARFRPAGGETSFSRSDRVTPVTYRTYAVDVQTGRLIEMNGPIRLRPHGTL